MMIDTDKIETAYPVGRCYCGCGEALDNPTKYFVASHDRRAETRVVKEVYGSVANFLVAHGYGPDSQEGTA